MTLAYFVIFIISLAMPVSHFFLARGKGQPPWLPLLYSAVAVVNLGYLLLSISKTVEFALLANKIAYLGQVVVPLCMFRIISGLCGFKAKRWVTLTLVCASALMLALVLTTGHFDWYYSSVQLVIRNGAAMLVKEYGPLHPVNLIYVLTYFVLMLATVGISLRRSKSDGRSKKLAGLMLAVVIGNVGMWIVEKFITLNFEFLSISYLMSELVFFFVYWMMEDPSRLEGGTIIVVDSIPRAERLKTIVASLPEGVSLTARQTDILERILEGKSRKEIAAELHLSENTVKTHTASLYRTLGVSGREEIWVKFH